MINPLPKTWQYYLLRIGSVSKGLVYVLMGLFCLGTVIGIASSTGGPQETIRWLGQNPYGQVVYVLLGAGIGSYALWRLYRGIFDTGKRGSSAGGLFIRLNDLVVALAYGGLSFYAFRRLFTAREGGEIREDALQILLGWPYGDYLIYGIALATVGAGVNAIYIAWTDAHMLDISDWDLTEGQEAFYNRLGSVGLVGVALVYFIMAWSLYRVGRLHWAEEFRGVGESLSYLEGWGLGFFLMAITGVGLLAYGLFMFFCARYEYIERD